MNYEHPDEMLDIYEQAFEHEMIEEEAQKEQEFLVKFMKYWED